MQEELVLDERFADIPGLELKAEEFDREAEKYARKAEAVRQIIAGVRALNGDAEGVLMRRAFQSHATAFETRPPDLHGPRGKQAVLRVMGEAPDRIWKVVDVKREMLRRGWAPSPKAVEGSIAALRAEGKIEPVEYGFYKLASAMEATGANEDEAVVA